MTMTVNEILEDEFGENADEIRDCERGAYGLGDVWISPQHTAKVADRAYECALWKAPPGYSLIPLNDNSMTLNDLEGKG